MIRTDHLDAFAVFARHLNFTHAAKALHLSQPALHAQVNQLAEDLGVPLYRRVGRGLELTAEGERLAAFARQQRRVHAAMRAELVGRSAALPVTLAAGEGAYLYLLGPGLQRFRDTCDSPLQLLTLDRAGCLEAVRLGRAQLAVTALDRVPRDLTGVRVARIGAAIAAPADHPLAGLKAVHPADLEGARLVVPPEGAPLRAAVERALAGVDWTVAVEARGWPLTLRFAALGLGVAVVNGFVSPPEGVVLRPFVGLPTVDYQLLRRRGAELFGGTQALWEALRATA
ncbi:MAG: LysR family transcriptional regulator [Alphaproteobacteria bacterium]|nr:LysR family transcriptional regulator [Alphaproteobacteria bacterium]